MRIIQRYLASSFLLPFIVSLSFFIVFLLVFQLFRLLDIVINKGVALSELMSLIGHISVSFVPMAVPLSIFFSAIFVLNRLSEDSEFVAMRSFGLSKAVLFRPFMVLGAVIALSLFVLGLEFIPYSKRVFKNSIIRLTSQGMLSDIRAEQFFTDIPGVILFAEEVAPGGPKLKNVMIRNRSKGSKGPGQVIFAKRGQVIKRAAQGPGGIPSIDLKLFDGNIIKTTAKGDVHRMQFETYFFPAMSGNFTPGFVNRDSMRSGEELWDDIKNHQSKKISAKDLVRTKLEFWSRINSPIQVMLFLLMGLSLGVKKGRGRQAHTGPLALGFLIGHYSVFFIGISMAKKGNLAPELAVFVPTALFFTLALWAYSKLDWYK